MPPADLDPAADSRPCGGRQTDDVRAHQDEARSRVGVRAGKVLQSQRGQALRLATVQVALGGVGGAPAASGLGRGAVDPERHGDDVGRDPQELKVSGVDAPVVVQIRDHIRRIVEDAVMIEIVDDRDGESGVDILAGDGRTHDPGVPQLGLLGVPVGDAGEVEQVS